jgi:carbon-monoxide dehydrogenase small subunit
MCRCTGYENIVRSIRWAAEHGGGARTADAATESAPGREEVRA